MRFNLRPLGALGRAADSGREFVMAVGGRDLSRRKSRAVWTDAFLADEQTPFLFYPEELTGDGHCG